MRSDIAISFVHEYLNKSSYNGEAELPSMWCIKDGKDKILNFPSVRNISDFNYFKYLIDGEAPLTSAENFARLPRFGLTGLSRHAGHIYAASWNSVYEICDSTLKLKRIISNRLMSDLHSVCVHDGKIYTVLTGKDTVVVSDLSGEIIDYFTILRDLTVVRDETLLSSDWRFLSKQFRGATGFWHINHIQIIQGKLYLTSRNLGAFIVCDTTSQRAFLKTINHKTPVLLHDGDAFDGQYYFTSIDGKIIIAEEAHSASFNPREETENIEKFNRDLISRVIRIEETSYNRVPNWCRGIYVNEHQIYTSIDGRYDLGDSFGTLEFDKSGNMQNERRLQWSAINKEEEIRYATGFDIINI